MNTITLCGRLGRDAEEKILDSGQRLLNLTLATNIRRAGNEETLWWRITIWGDRFKPMEPYLKKGAALIVVGTMHYPRIYQDQNGINQVSLDITAHNINFSPFGSATAQDTQPMQTPPQNQTTTKETLGQPQQGQNTSEDISKVFDENYGSKEDKLPF